MNKILPAALIAAALQILQSEIVTLAVLIVVMILLLKKLLNEAAERY